MTTLSCPAKINLFLAIHDRDESGYHEIETILARAPQLQDFIHIEPAEEFSFECDIDIPENNSVVQAVRLLEQEAGRKFNYGIRLEKNIPPRSGLGGGAANAAAILLYLNEHESLKIPHNVLMELAAKIGMDVPFFVSGHPIALATHYGEKITPLPDLPKNLIFEIHLTGMEISTREAFAAWDVSKQKSKADVSQILQAIKKQDATGIIKHLHNDFQLMFSQPSQPSCDLLLSGSGGSLVSFRVI